MTQSELFPEKATPTTTPVLEDTGPATAHFETLPLVDINEVVGICEVVHEYGGCIDFHQLAREFGCLRLMPMAMEGARMLGLIKMHNGEVALSPLGRTWIQGGAQERQRVLHDQMACLTLIRWLCTLLRNSDSGAISADDLLGKMSMLVSDEKARSTFWTLVNWGTYAGLFHYEEDRKILALRSRDSMTC